MREEEKIKIKSVIFAWKQCLRFIFLLFLISACAEKEISKPNVIFVLACQWLAQDVGCNGNSVVKTPENEQLSKESVVFVNAVYG